ncbi:MAG: CinA family protein [Candidatus Omnitrophota bacterium]|nr:CinA family protein [Candidatus Omnitrophota bacterium]
MKTEQKIAKLLKQKHKTISIAESCTGGLICHKLTNIPGSSRYFKLGIVAYSNQAKINLLNISENLIKTKGAVSKEACLLMAKNIRKIAKTDFGMAITGIAGPTGATATKPVGLVYIALAIAEKSIVKKFNFKGRRLSIKSLAAESALKLLEKML